MRKVRRTSLGHIQWENSTGLPTPLITKWVRRSCQRWSQLLEIPADWTKKSLGTFVARNRFDDYTSGRAWIFGRRTLVSFSAVGQESDQLKYWKRFFNVVAHEIGHMAVGHKERVYLAKQSRRHGMSWGGDEEYICRISKKFENEISDEEVRSWINEASFADGPWKLGSK